MSPARRILLCNCNRTMDLDGKRLAQALGTQPLEVASELCRKQLGEFRACAGSGDDMVVACTQEAPLFSELHAELKAAGDIRFANIRETAGWSEQGRQALPKIAALLALAQLPDPEPVPVVSYRSAGQLLVIGEARAALAWAERLRGQLSVNVLITAREGEGELPVERAYPVHSGDHVRVTGYLGAFEVSWEQANPVDLDVCTRCNACVDACPERAIDYLFQIDLEKCRAHRQCVAACGSIKAIDFDRSDRARSGRYDLVLDLCRDPLITVTDPPQGYAAPGSDRLEQAHAAAELVRLTGEFEKPKYFEYREKICAHSRARIVGCTRCIDVCSTGAITSNAKAERIDVDPHLCMGCGGCATVCPSGAMSYAYPRVADVGARVRTLLDTYRAAGGQAACLLFHNGKDGRELLARLGRRSRGLPARVIPLEINHVAAMGVDTVLGCIAFGAAQVAILAAGSEAPQYLAALRSEFGLAGDILAGLGYGRERIHLLEAGDVDKAQQAIWQLPSPTDIPAATFDWFNDKRTTLDFVFQHLLKHAPQPVEEIPLRPGAPFGRIEVNAAACTLCMSCVGACPEGALLDSRAEPQLKFIERLCVQCGLCEKTCPEQAITLKPRLLLTKAARDPALLNEAQPFSCVRCGKPFGTRQMIDKMLGRLSEHSMYTTRASLDRLQMCADCRVIDMMQNREEVSILDLPSANGREGLR